MNNTACPTRFRAAMTIQLFLAAITVFTPGTSFGQDVIEFLSGTRLQGNVSKIDKQLKQVHFEFSINGRESNRIFTYKKIHAITYKGSRYVITPLSVEPTKTASRFSSSNGPLRSKTEIDQMIDALGKTPPEWFSSTQLNFPKTLDLSFPQPPPKEGGWNNKKNVGQFYWDIVNPNPSRWHEGIRLMHHLLKLNYDDPSKRQRIMNLLGRNYHNLIQDYARAAFWYKQAGVDRGGRYAGTRSGTNLAECYWRLGSKKAAVELLNKLPVTFQSIKLWGDMGETKRAEQLAISSAKRSPKNAARCFLMAGNACRQVDQFEKAITLYEESLKYPKSRTIHSRARANIAAINVFEKLDISKVPDGAYSASMLGYVDQVHIQVTVKSGRIQSVEVTKHREKQFYSSLEDTTRKIVDRQSIKGIQATSGATITSQAIINSTANALHDAMTH